MELHNQLDILVLVKQMVGGVIMSLFKSNATKTYDKPTRVNNVYGGPKKPIISNMKIMVIEIKPYQSNNTLMKLNHT